MEEGSLLQHVLQRQGQGQDGEKNVLVLDIFSMKDGLLDDQASSLLFLADLAKQCNEFLRSKDYLWHFGGDGPVFGIHVSDEAILHLRAYCAYGPNVQDEWMIIDFMFELSNSFEHDIAICCWDVDDGQVMLIQTADVIPEWLDEDPSDSHRYACFIRKGHLQLIQQAHVSLPQALKGLQHQKDHDKSSHPRIQNALIEWLEINRRNVNVQKTPLVVPRKIAVLMKQRPDLVHIATQAFCAHIEEKPPSISHHEDWVWVVHELSRTNYAMARTLVSKEWENADFLPKLPIEVKRYKRQCAMEATPHLQHAVQLGVRLVVGFEFLLQSKLVPPSLEERMAHLCRIERSCSQDTKDASWIVESFQQGPNQSAHDMTQLLKCPVYPEERGFPTLHSMAEISLRQQLLNAQKLVDEDEETPMPLADEIDDESWLDLKGGDSPETNDLNGVLSQFQTFMVQPSGPEGVDPEPAMATIRPRIFMNILHRVLKGEELSFPSSDPFFYQEDYDLMDDNNGTNESEPVEAMRGIMDAMDAELKGKLESRAPDDSNFGDIGDNEEVAENAHVLDNLLQSLEASEGKSGPVSNMLKEMNKSVAS